ncbi:hypothetical protein O9G_005999 [Rozella allomycis CSF55]|uniref:Uncharacterized protein n=1 Tax=Rozella allomycis (strain CSF55) TaxID=988480 RepID=A0A075AS37_ROZAC|nr:hypothetical protein O9G_005999 [Rozella allomycis CSF55]|eukprot:EPZ31368.1 hypothetical protein O9G_005999 [Rozella allomycis CSF55]
MDEWKTPVTGKMIEQQLGFFNYFRDLIPNYASLTAPLDKLRKQKSLYGLKNLKIFTRSYVEYCGNGLF